MKKRTFGHSEKCRQSQCVAIRFWQVICIDRLRANSNFGMLRLALRKTGGQEIWRQGFGEAVDGLELGAFGVAIRF